MAVRLHHFNPVEAQDYFLEKLDALITFACDMVRGGVFCFISYLISLQYRRDLRLSLIQRMKENAYTASTIQQRKNFITFCAESVKVNTPERDGIFEKYFFPFFLKLGYQEENYSVQLHLIKNLTPIRAAIIESGDVSALNKLNQMMADLEEREGMQPDALKKLIETASKFKSDAEMARISAMASVDTEAKRAKGIAHLEGLAKREEFEKAALKRMIQERELRRKRKSIIQQMEGQGKQVPEMMRTRSHDRRTFANPSLSSQQRLVTCMSQVTDVTEPDETVEITGPNAKKARQASVNVQQRPPSAGHSRLISPGRVKPITKTQSFYMEAQYESSLTSPSQFTKVKSPDAKSEGPDSSRESTQKINSGALNVPTERNYLTSPMRKRLLKAVGNQAVSSATLQELAQTQKKVIKVNKISVEGKKKLVLPTTCFVERNDLTNYLQDAEVSFSPRSELQNVYAAKAFTQSKTNMNKSQPQMAIRANQSVEDGPNAKGTDGSKTDQIQLLSPNNRNRAGQKHTLKKVAYKPQNRDIFDTKSAPQTDKSQNGEGGLIAAKNNFVLNSDLDTGNSGERSSLLSPRFTSGRNSLQPMNQATLIAAKSTQAGPAITSPLKGIASKMSQAQNISVLSEVARTQHSTIVQTSQQPKNQSAHFDHTQNSTVDSKQKMSVTLSEPKRSNVTLKLKGIIQSKKQQRLASPGSRVLGELTTGPASTSRIKTAKRVMLGQKKSSRSSCTSTPGRRCEPIIPPRISAPKRTSTPKRQFGQTVETTDLLDDTEYLSDYLEPLELNNATVNTSKTPAKVSRRKSSHLKLKELQQKTAEKSNQILVFNTPKNNTRNSQQKQKLLSNLSGQQRRSIVEPDEEPCDPELKFSPPIRLTSFNYFDLGLDDQSQRKASVMNFSDSEEISPIRQAKQQAKNLIKTVQRGAGRLNKKHGSLNEVMPETNFQSVMSSTFSRASSLCATTPKEPTSPPVESHSRQQKLERPATLQTLVNLDQKALEQLNQSKKVKSTILQQQSSASVREGTLNRLENSAQGKKKNSARRRSTVNSQNTSIFASPGLAQYANFAKHKGSVDGQQSKTLGSALVTTSMQKHQSDSQARKNESTKSIKINQLSSGQKQRDKNPLKSKNVAGSLNLSHSQKVLTQESVSSAFNKSSKRNSIILANFAQKDSIGMILAKQQQQNTLKSNHQKSQSLAENQMGPTSQENSSLIQQHSKQTPSRNFNRVPSKSFIQRQLMKTQMLPGYTTNAESGPAGAPMQSLLTQQHDLIMQSSKPDGTEAQPSTSSGRPSLQQKQLQAPQQKSNQATVTARNSNSAKRKYLQQQTLGVSSLSQKQLVMRKNSSHKTTINHN